MKLQQILRYDKVFNERFFLLSKNQNNNKLIFEISGSTSNIYKVQIYESSKKIFCNCPDSKKWAKMYNVACKHICFLLIKVFKLNNNDLEYFYENLVLNDINLYNIVLEYNNINFSNNEQYINSDFLEKFKTLDNLKQEIVLKEDYNKDCCICFDNLENLENIKDTNNNIQCKICLIIIHKSCLNKWFNMNNNNCPHCRSIINTDNNSYYKNLLN